MTGKSFDIGALLLIAFIWQTKNLRSVIVRKAVVLTCWY